MTESRRPKRMNTMPLLQIIAIMVCVMLLAIVVASNIITLHFA